MSVSADAPPAAPDFAPRALCGAGDPLNAYAHSAAWFGSSLMLGTTRANLSLLKIRGGDQLDPWPTHVPLDAYEQDLHAQVLAYDPIADTWRVAFRSPSVPGRGGLVPRDIGYRGMAVYRASHDPAPCLYVAGWASARSGLSPALLRSPDGWTFDALPGVGADERLTSYRALRPFGGWLYAAPTSRAGRSANAAGAAAIIATDSPASGRWTTANANELGEGDELGVVELAALGPDLYASTINPSRGFSLWRCAPVTEPPHRWVRHLGGGAGRGPLNEAGLSLCAFRDALYVGTAIQNGGYDRAHGIGPAAAELLRVHPDGSWDLLVGERRNTPDGYKVPLSGLGPGFDNPFNGYIWRLTVHGGRLYATTYNWAVFLPYLRFGGPPRPGTAGRPLTRQAAGAAYGGFELWSSEDGVRWRAEMRGGFGTPYNYGGRGLVSTPHGLAVGTANPFGPEVAVPDASGWRYERNPRGGFELWMEEAA